MIPTLSVTHRIWRGTQLWLDLEAPTVGASYGNLVRMARRQAGQQMNSAWLEPVIANDAGMNLGVAYPRDQIDDARQGCALKMARALRLFGRGRRR